MDGTAADRDVLEEQLQNPSASPISLPYEFLKDITNNFSTERELGKGGYGVVYKGVLRSGKIIAVKQLLDSNLVNDDVFQKEVTNVMGIRHKNIVQLVGYCAESTWEAIKQPNGNHVMAEIPKRMLCFEYLPNKGLDNYIPEESSGLDWNKRYEIIKGVCSGLHFLNRECHIVHLDLKPENILMDATMRPKIADFGLSKLLGAQKSQTIIHGSIAGSLGYMAPEYLLRGIVSPQADIFSFGVVIIKIITGQNHDYPSSTALLLQHQHVNANNGGTSTEISVQQYIDNVLVKWRNVFQEEQKYTSPQTYTKQVKEFITIALECVHPDSARRPDICEVFERLTGEICCCQKMTLLSVQPSNLHFNFTASHMLSSSSLHLTNNTDDTVAFRIKANDRNKYFPKPVHGLVLPRSMYTLRVPMLTPPEDDNYFAIKLECTIAGDQYQLSNIKASSSAGDYNHFFEEAKKRGREVQQAKLLFSHEIRDVVIPGYPGQVVQVYAHPTKTWIVSQHRGLGLEIWDYQREENVPLSESVIEPRAAVFIPRKQWFVVGNAFREITVCNYETMQELKTFRAHDKQICCLDIHPSEPYMLSSSSFDETVKIWNWEMDWECVRTFHVKAGQVKFNSKDADYFACATRNGVKVWNIASSGSDDLTFTFGSSDVHRIDYLSRGDELYLITGNVDGSVEIWDWQSQSCLKTLKEHTRLVNTVRAHPDLPLFITGSRDGKVYVWNSSTFEFSHENGHARTASIELNPLKLEVKLNCGLGVVHAVAWLKGSNRIAIAHEKGLAITEI